MFHTNLALIRSAIGIAAISLLTFSPSAQAFNLVFNGGFESITNLTGTTQTTGGQLGYNRLATGWTNASTTRDYTGPAYNFVYGSGTADTTGVVGQYGTVKFWGPNSGSANGLPASSPTGGNFLAADGAFGEGAISQTISGLTVGKSYTLTFWWAGAQQTGFDGPTTDQWRVSLGSQTKFTSVLNNVNHGFTGWQFQTFNFTAESASSLLSFFAIGTPEGTPPFSLLDGVNLEETPVPEPAMALPAVLLVSGLVAVRRIASKRKSDQA
ncbi:MAG: PEP-CTERM sorting domain-containing protein [Anaerolineae bacterium]|nr:PEP-CTERM sorting domain-containing protein [Gloeobacterales cyanobacterium ES-bin-313]